MDDLEDQSAEYVVLYRKYITKSLVKCV